MANQAITTGYFNNGLPYIKIGDSQQKLVIFDGLDFSHQPPSGMMLRMRVNSFKRFAEEYTVYIVSRNFPKEEMYGLKSQLRRSEVSIPSNIAEGFARLHNREYRNFLYISLGSCAELTTQIIIASRLKYVEKTKADALLNEIEEISKMTMSLIKKLNTND